MISVLQDGDPENAGRKPFSTVMQHRKIQKISATKTQEKRGRSAVVLFFDKKQIFRNRDIPLADPVNFLFSRYKTGCRRVKITYKRD